MCNGETRFLNFSPIVDIGEYLQRLYNIALMHILTITGSNLFGGGNEYTDVLKVMRKQELNMIGIKKYLDGVLEP